MDNLVTSNIRQRPIRTLVSVAGVALGVTLIMLFTGLARGMSNDLQRRASNVRAELIFMRPGAVQLTATTANLDARYVERLSQIDFRVSKIFRLGTTRTNLNFDFYNVTN